MKVFIVGGTGLLGSVAAAELIARGHQVKTLALPPLPPGAVLAPEMEIVFGDYLTMSDDDLRALMVGFDGFVFAAGIDERVESTTPIYDLFTRHNYTALERFLRLAKEVGIKHSVICGSYFSHFAKKYPKLKMRANHVYVRSRLEQEEMALAFASPTFDVTILELPYIFGTQPGRKPVWVFLIEMIKAMKKRTYYSKGGTAMVTTKQVGQGIAGALETMRGANTIPFGYYNLTWHQFLSVVHKAMGYQNRKIVTVPTVFVKIAAVFMQKKKKKAGIYMGLDLVKYARVQAMNLFITKEEGSALLGVDEDDIEAAIIDSVNLSLAIINHQQKHYIEMK